MLRQLNAATLSLNASTEQTRLVAYDDARPSHILQQGEKIQGTLTIGRGHTGLNIFTGKPLQIGDTWTLAQVEQAQLQDLAAAEGAVQSALDCNNIAMTDNQLGATTDFVFNIGIGQFERSTARKLIVAGRLDAVPAEFQRYIYSKGRKLPGLVNRRAKETLLYNSPEPIVLPPATEPSVTPDPVNPVRPLMNLSVISACTSGFATLCAYAPDIGNGLSNAANQLQPIVDYNPHIKLAIMGCTFGAIACGGIASFMHHRKDASE